MNKENFLSVGGWDIMYPSMYFVDWDFFLKCELHGYKMIRSYKCNFYHFAQKSNDFLKKEDQEIKSYEFFTNKWKKQPRHNSITNSKMIW